MSMIVPPPNIPLPPPVVTSPAVSNVILTSTSHFTLQPHPLDARPDPRHLGLVTIYYALREARFDRVSIFQPSPHKIPDIDQDQGSIIDEFKKMGADQKGAVIGISTTTDEYFKFPYLSRLFHQVFPDAQIVAGGVHFYRDQMEGHSDTVDLVLIQGLADAVQVGHAQGFIDFIIKHDGDLEAANGPGFYRQDPASHEIIGQGEGKFPRTSGLPYYYSRHGKRVSLILRDVCPNGCDFCSASVNRGALFSWRTIRMSLQKIFEIFTPRWMSLRDSNPLGPKNFSYYRRVFDIMDTQSPTLKNIYLNPALLIDDEYRHQLVDFFERHQVYSFFAGRDAVMQKVAQIIGSRNMGLPKDQGQLDAEREALVKFVQDMKGTRLPRPPILVLSYIVTPFETRESAQALLDEIMMFDSLIEPGFRISVGLFPLMPYPGTRLRAHLAAYIDPEDFDFHKRVNGTIVPWKSGAGPGLPLMVEIENKRSESPWTHLMNFSEVIKKIWGN